jgi:HK97 family phage portal protein
MPSLLGDVAQVLSRAPVPYVSRAQEGISRLPLFFGSNKTAQLEAMTASGTLFAIVNRLSEAMSQIEWRLYRKPVDGRRVYGPEKAKRTEVTRHAALSLWTEPNDFYDNTAFIEASQQHYELTGEWWWVMYRAPGIAFPTEMWPVRPDRMEPIPSRDRFIAGYVYHGPDGEDIPLDLDEVIYVRKPNPLDPYRGLGAVQSILSDIDASKLSSEWVRAFFHNSAEPGGIIEVPETLSDDEFRTLRSRWDEQHRGISRAHRVAVLEKGKWVERKYTNKDMELTELRNVNREVIREAYGFPKSILGISEDVNRANAEAAEVTFARWLVTARARRYRTTLNTKLLPMFGSMGSGYEFDFDDPIPEDAGADEKKRNSKSLSANRLVLAGYHPDDVTEAVELPKMRWVGLPTQGGDSPPSDSPGAAERIDEPRGGSEGTDVEDE